MQTHLVRPIAVVLLAIGLLAGVTLGVRQALDAAAYSHLQRTFTQVGTHLTAMHEVVVATGNQLSADAAPTAISTEAKRALRVLQFDLQPFTLPGSSGTHVASARRATEPLARAIDRVIDAQEEGLHATVLLQRSFELARASREVEHEWLQPHTLSLAVPLDEWERTYQVTWLTSWSHELEQVDRAALTLVDRWVAWQERDLPAWVRDGRWLELELKTASDLAAVELLRPQFEQLPVPERAVPVHTRYVAALRLLERAHRRVQSYVLGQGLAVRLLREAEEALAEHSTARAEALQMLADLKLHTGE